MAGGNITTGSYALDYEPMLRHWFMMKEQELDPLYKRIFKEQSTTQKFNHDTVFGGLGHASIKPEGSSVTYDSMVQGKEIVYEQAVYANGFSISKEAVDFAQQNVVMQNQASELRKSLNETKEELLADVIDNAFINAYTGFDGKELCATDHPIQDGLTTSNELAVAADLSEAALEQMHLEQSDEMKDYRGKRSRVSVDFLIVPTEEVFNAQRILGSNQRNATADNDTNAIKDLKFLSEDVMHHERLTDADAYFLKCGIEDGLKVYQSQGAIFQADNDFDTFNMKFIGHERYAYGWSDYRTLFGCPGAG